MKALREFQRRVHETAKDHGWWVPEREDGTLIALMHSELSEALEGLRDGNPPDKHVPEFSSVEVELGDVIIRILDFAEASNYDVVGVMIAKAKFNEGRPYRHGGKEL